MKTYTSGQLSRNRAEIMDVAHAEGVHLVQRKTNGEPAREFVIISKEAFLEIDDGFNGVEPRVYPEDF